MATELQAPELPASPDGQAAPVSSNSQVPLPPRNPELVKVAVDLVTDALDSLHEADPKAAVEYVLRELVASKRYDVLVEAARQGLLELVWRAVVRSDPTRRPALRNAAQSGKWEAVADAMESRRDIFEARVYTGTEVKFLGDCTKADLIAGAEFKSKQANTMLDNAERMNKLARELKADQVVADLDRQVVEDIFNA